MADQDTPTRRLKSVENEDQNPSKGREYSILDCQAETVVVYLDRAEVTRSLAVKVEKGENEIVIKDIQKCVDKDSVRVEGRGPITIAEVALRTKYLAPDERQDVKEEQSKLERKLEEAKRLREILQLRRTRLEKQRNVLDGFADNAIKGSGITVPDGTTSPSFLSKDNLVGMTAFLELFDRQASRLDDSLHHLKQEQEKNNDLIQSLEHKLGESSRYKMPSEIRELVVLLEASKHGEVTLCISYVVTSASWTPSYDIRVYGDEKQMKIQYYGMITQDTGEDWLDTKLCLSTAMPSVGGEVPSLGTQRVSFKPKAYPCFAEVKKRKPGSSFRFKERRAVEVEEEISVSNESDLPNNVVSGVKVKESITTTMYEIARRSTIPCDNVGHKVTVAIIDLKPEFEYQTVPKVSAKAFLKAKVKNTSPYALLAGPSNIFLDNNFITKSELKAVSPNEEFVCSLGVDPTIRVEYKPLLKYREQSGLISKTTSMTYKQVIQIKNTHRDVIKILVLDQLPLSTEERIKVTLLEPVIKHPEKYDPTKPIRLNSDNNIEWDLEIPAGETNELVLKYSIEHPANEEIESKVTAYSSS